LVRRLVGPKRPLSPYGVLPTPVVCVSQLFRVYLVSLSTTRNPLGGSSANMAFTFEGIAPQGITYLTVHPTTTVRDKSVNGGR